MEACSGSGYSFSGKSWEREASWSVDPAIVVADSLKPAKSVVRHQRLPRLGDAKSSPITKIRNYFIIWLSLFLLSRYHEAHYHPSYCGSTCTRIAKHRTNLFRSVGAFIEDIIPGLISLGFVTALMIHFTNGFMSLRRSLIRYEYTKQNDQGKQASSS